MRFLIFLILFSSCCAKTGKNSVNSPVTAIANPLDSILGEKVLSENPLTIRPDNFSDLIGMPASALSDSSVLYAIDRLDSTLWIMRQDGHYMKSRKFAILIKTDGKTIVRYKALNDFGIDDHLFVSDGFVFISGITELAPFPGQLYDHYFRITKVDSDLNDIWTYRPQSAHSALCPGKLRKEGNHYVVPVDVIVSSTMVYHTVRIELDEKGKYISGRQTASANCNDTLPRETIDFIFTNRKR